MTVLKTKIRLQLKHGTYAKMYWLKKLRRRFNKMNKIKVTNKLERM